MASGNELIGEYWSSNESGTVAWRVNLAPPAITRSPKPIPIKSVPCWPFSGLRAEAAK